MHIASESGFRYAPEGPRGSAFVIRQTLTIFSAAGPPGGHTSQMPELGDHDRINVLQAAVAGLLLAMNSVIDALETVGRASPEIADRLAEPLVTARAAMAVGDRTVDRAEAVGEARWDMRAPDEKGPDST